MNQILFEDLGNGLDLTRITFIRERSLLERNEFEILRHRERCRRRINDEVLFFHRQRELDIRLMEYQTREIENNIINEIRQSTQIIWSELQERVAYNNPFLADFWEPVKITVELDTFEFTEEDWECIICREERSKKTSLNCCNQFLCDVCTESWFTKESIRCPFCKKDIREIKC
jgi:hypothetical protein